MSALSDSAINEIRSVRSAVFAAVSLHPKTAVAISLVVGLVIGLVVGSLI